MWKFILNEPNENEFMSEATNIRDDKIQNKKMIITEKYNKHTLHRNT